MVSPNKARAWSLMGLRYTHPPGLFLELTECRYSSRIDGDAVWTRSADGIEQRVRASPVPVRLINSRGVDSMPPRGVLVNTGFVDR